ncbi:hypothetical protein SLEP1_g29724 [Rubroshorea leprosula]|uniref:Uncharacterized protein n=1 Tax=Rubroshorea leprosula TaxID=152421 RepID=A0AAV5JXV3_9ROSI|nr:hypothetical protein SLEP1_g29724 [Rubroshorea leprosula]
MSSEETLSVGGSEGEQGLSLTNGDEVESSRSERSGGVGGEMVEVGIPPNVLEVDPDRAKFYNEDEEVVEEVAGYESTWKKRSDLTHLVEQYAIPGHVLLRPAGERERACSAPRDHWMPVYGHYLTAGLRFPVPELLVALLLEYGLGLTQLVPNTVRLILGFLVYCRTRGVIPTVAGGGGRNLFSAGPSSIKGWKDKFFFVDDTKWEKLEMEVTELSRWKRKRSNPNQYSLSSGEQEEVERLERRGGDVMDIMHFSSPAMLEAAEIYGPSSMTGEMNRLMSKRKTVALPEKRLKTPAAPSVGERVLGGTSRSRPEGSARAEVGPSSDQGRKRAEEAAAQKRKRVEEVQHPQTDALIEFVPRPPPVQIDPALREVGMVGHGKGKESPIPRQKSSFYESTSKTAAKRFIRSTFPEVDLNRARHEVEEHGGSGVVRHALETVNLINALAAEYYDCLKERNNLVDKYDELNLQKQSVEQNFNDLTSELEKVREELVSAKAAADAEVEKRRRAEEELAKAQRELAEVQKRTELEVHNSVEKHVSEFVNSETFSEIVDLFRMPTLVMAFNDCRKKVKAQNPEVDVTKVTFGPEEAGVEEDGESRTAEFRPDITLSWEREEAGRTVLPPRLEYEFVDVDEETEAPATAEVGENAVEQEVDQQHVVID